MMRLRYLWPLGVRTQLSLWYTVVFAILILLFSVVISFAVQSAIMRNYDEALELRLQEIAAGISTDNGTITLQNVTGELPGLQSVDTPTTKSSTPARSKTKITPGAHSNQQDSTLGDTDENFGTFVRILDSKGKTFYVTPAFHLLLVPSISVTGPLHGVVWKNTVSTSHGHQVRLYSAGLYEGGKIFGVIQVAEPLTLLNKTLKDTIVEMLFIAPFILLLGAIGSYWLARRALAPIERLTSTAQRIGNGGLHQRVLVPRARDELRYLALTFNEMIDRLDKAFLRQQRFVAHASHELRTPVAAIRCMAEVGLAHAATIEEHIATLIDITVVAERLGRLIQDLLMLARADEGQAPLDHEFVRLDLLVNDVVATIEAMAIERGMRLQVQAPEPTLVRGDRAQLIQIIMNLVGNALTYTNAGGMVTVGIEVSGDRVHLIVHDTGIGIGAEHIPHIFERFYRADPARSRKTGGSGLGLSITDWLVRMHEGTITVDSEVGKGSIFTVILPRAFSAEAEPDANTDSFPS